MTATTVERTVHHEAGEDDLVQCARDWGWRNPAPGILDIARQARDARLRKTGELLVDMGVVTEEQCLKWLSAKPESTQTITWFAQQDASVVPYVDRILALKAGYPYYDLVSRLSVHSSMLDTGVVTRAEELDAAVMAIEDTVPVVVFSTFAALIRFRSLGRAERHRDPILQAAGEDVRLALGARDEISAVLKSVRSADDSIASMEAANVWNTASAANQSRPENREITRLLDHALIQGATDVALKPFRGGDLQVQFRKFGEMMHPKSVPGRMNADLARQVVALLQSRSGANPTNTIQRVPTDGQITYRSGAGDAYLRLSFLPLNHLGELRNLTSVSIRLLPRAEASISLRDLRLEPAVIEAIRYAMRMSQGLVLLVGPTNSGKSSTISGAIGEHVGLFGDRRKRLSLEDPIERHLYGIQQINAPTHIRDEAERFEVCLRAFKRHDPDLIWVGEVRDRVTAELCVASASTGHLVLSTLHANDAVMAVDVLAKSVAEDKRFQLIEALSLVISQRLVKQACPHCRDVGAPTDEEQQLFARYTEMIGEPAAALPATIARAKGCDRCEDGYIGLLPIAEVLPLGRRAKDAALAMLVGGATQRETLARMRSRTLLDSGLDLLARHEVDLDAILV